MLSAQRHPLVAAVAVLAVLFVVAVALAAGPGPRAMAQQPSQVATRLADAAEDLAAGRTTEARAAYLAVLVSPAAVSPALRDEAWTGLIRAATAAPAAAALASALLGHDPADGDGVRYLYATALGSGGSADGAALAFRRIAAAGGPLATVARLRVAQRLAAAGRDAEAAAAFRAAAIDARLPPQMRAVAALGGAGVLSSLGRLREALDLLDAAATDPRTSAADVATMRWRAATLRRDAGDPRWTDDAAATIAVAPGAPQATLALDALVDVGEPVDPLAAAYVRYRARDNGDARQRYEAALAGDPAATTAHVAWFYLGALAERAPDERRAIAAYTASLEAAPQGWLADDARWWLGLLLELAGRPADAAEQFERLAADFPASPFARGARLLAPVSRAAAGDSASAFAQLRALTQNASADTSARAARWLAVLGGEDGGPVLDPAAFDPTSIATILHLAGEAATAPLPDAAREEWSTPTPDWAEAATWMEATFGPPPASEPALDGRLATTIALAAVDERDAARAIALDLLEATSSRPYTVLALARAASDAGLHDVAIRASIRLLGPLSPQQRLQTPFALERLAYPLQFASSIIHAAEGEDLPPLLLAALVRQESAFEPLAGSFAGARGLTQVIPPTGEAIASSLGVPWDPRDLLRAESSLRFGAHYLAAQLELFNGDTLAALAAYNGGPGNAARWQDRSVWPGADGYIHAIDFAETQTYVERVLETYGWYRFLYADAERPSMR